MILNRRILCIFLVVYADTSKRLRFSSIDFNFKRTTSTNQHDGCDDLIVTIEKWASLRQKTRTLIKSARMYNKSFLKFKLNKRTKNLQNVVGAYFYRYKKYTHPPLRRAPLARKFLCIFAFAQEKNNHERKTAMYSFLCVKNISQYMFVVQHRVLEKA